MKRTRTKAIQAACLLTLLCVLLAGCGASGAFDGSKATDESGFRMEYKALNREETAALQLAAGEEIQVVFSHTAGSVDVTVGQEGKEPIYKGTAQENAEFLLTVSEEGIYKISVTGHQAKGKVSFTRLAANPQ